MSTSTTPFTPLTGSCPCRTITYTLTRPPLITNCCHCHSCQVETGTAFALNMIIESRYINLTSPSPPSSSPARNSPSSPARPSSPTPILTSTPTSSTSPHLLARCPTCSHVLWSHYLSAHYGTAIAFVRAGTLDVESKGRVRPDAHIFVESKVWWVDLRGERERGVWVGEGRYRREEVWGGEALGRLGVVEREMGEGKEVVVVEGRGKEGDGEGGKTDEYSDVVDLDKPRVVW
ncbi:hypothetical protein EJ04DRAFT_583176 [Polyplosphaeria fusca]|uniref:CENP-V/GFA domain-containing protein n=1 Tax=Polyplosphaeria fusca TaxID=682080 RepID=A0A9P4V9L0_9PLEO|nr:hypothetical protein EJ04DRAFT_583176 [Polyplosphaeria fusca]